MSATIKTFEQAITDEIRNGFMANQCEFSAHDVTVCIRKKVNDGLLEISGIPFQEIGGVKTQMIDHSDVRFFVHQHCTSNPLVGYERKWNPNAKGSGYYSWAAIQTTADDDDDADDAQTPFSTPASSIVSGMGQTPVVTAYPAADPADPMIVGKVVNYFTKKAQAGTPGTLHTAQRRMKRNPLTIAQIKQIAVDNGFTVHSRTGLPECESTVM
jgi:hypothetical protein